jgi:Zn-dependent protease with chaperone function
MEKNEVLYFDGKSARPSQVRVLLFHNQVHLYNPENDDLLESFPLKGSSYNQAGSSSYLYLGQNGLQYIQFSRDHELASVLAKESSEANMNWARRLMKQRIVVLLAFMIGVLVGFYFLLVTLVPVLGSRMISVDTEIKMGEKLRDLMIRQENIAGATVDKEGSVKLQAFADQLKLSETYPIRVTLVKSNILNAYALPGGQIVVYTGMLEKIKTPEALAALLAHESTHVNERHTLKSLLRKTANVILLSIVFGDLGGVTAGIVSNADALNDLHYSRSLEKEADSEGMDLLVENHVNLDGMRQLMMTLQEAGDLPESLSFLSTHPLTKERINAAVKYMKEHPQQVENKSDLNNAFRKLKNTDAETGW